MAALKAATAAIVKPTYGVRDVIRDLIASGFSTREVGTMTACLSDEGGGPCEDGIPRLLQKLEHIDRLRADLDARRERVLGRLTELHGASAAPQQAEEPAREPLSVKR